MAAGTTSPPLSQLPATGVEHAEALTAAAVAALTVIHASMTKAKRSTKAIVIREIRLESKSAARAEIFKRSETRVEGQLRFA